MTSAALTLDTLEALLPPPARTPLARLGRHWIKLEREQPAKSAKYRMVHHKLKVAAAAGRIGPRTVLTEVTSGSTGVALAFAGRALGLAVELHVTRHVAPEKLRRMSDLGAKVISHPDSEPVPSILETVAKAVAAGRVWHLNQYDRASTIAAYEGLAHEIVGQLRRGGDDQPEVFVCPVGSGGLIQGVGGILRGAYPDIEIVSIEPVSKTLIDGMRNTELYHMGPRDPYDRDFPDHRIEVSAALSCRSIEGRPVGESSTAAIAVVEGAFSRAAVLIAPD